MPTTMDMSILFELQDIHFSYPGAAEKVLNGVNCILHEGQRMGIIGPNGCGKTSLFHVIMGLLRPQSGRVVFRGKTLDQEKDFRELRREVGLLFQDADDQLFSPTVLEDVAFGPLNLGISPAEAAQTARDTLARLGLAELEARVTHQLSGGEKKLVSLATILAMQPAALLLDEPTNNLDQTTRSTLIEILAGLDLACIIISHDWDFLSEASRDIYAMDHGRLESCEKTILHDHHHAHPYGDHSHQHAG